MRIIAACSHCGRQFEASHLKPGDRFRCLCGRPVTVPASQGHEASVVRCSSCGAPREQGALACKYCGADFTLHEQDMETVCPKCLARVSNKAKFCHHCGQRIAPEAMAGQTTELLCPVCGEGHFLSSRKVGQVSLMECSRCVGLWLGHETLSSLLEQASRESLDIDGMFASGPVALAQEAGAAPQHGGLYRKCPQCRRLMNRRNYGRKSGVIVDICRDHGIWFDAEELPALLRWVRSGGLARAERQQAEQAAHEERLRRLAQPTGGRVPQGDYHSEPEPVAQTLGDVLMEAIWFLFER